MNRKPKYKLAEPAGTPPVFGTPQGFDEDLWHMVKMDMRKARNRRKAERWAGR